MTASLSPDDDARLDGVYTRHLVRIMLVMREHYPKVLGANRFFEEETGIHNELGTNNLNDALSHLGTLFEQAPHMTDAQQSHEVHDFEGHLRRGMMESYEQVFRMRMGQVDELWAKHDTTARPLQRNGKLHGVPPLQELDVLRRRCKALLDQGRAAKRGHDWAAWDQGTEALAEACRKATELAAALDEGIAVAVEQKKTARRFWVPIAVSIALAVVAAPLGYAVIGWLSDDTTTVPGVVGQPAAAAAARVANADLHLVEQVVGPERASHTCRVAESSPRAGSAVKEGSTIVLRLRC